MNLTGQGVYQKGVVRRRIKSPEEREDILFRAWLRKQPSALSGLRPCVAAHYRTAANSGVRCKPIMSAIPLTNEEHMRQHRIGQYNFMPREWWESNVEYYVNKFRSRL